MRKLIALFALTSAPLLAAESGRISDTERAYLVDQLEQTKKGVLDSLAGVTPSEWTFKAAPEKWSVAETAQHIVLAETFIFNGAQQILKTPAVARPEKSNAEVDHKLTEGVQDRSHKVTAPEPLVPSKPFATPAEAARAFTAKRDQTIEYVKTTNDDLRTHVGPGPAGTIDATSSCCCCRRTRRGIRHRFGIVRSQPGLPESQRAVTLD